MNVARAISRPFTALKRSVNTFLGRSDDPELAKRLGFFNKYHKVDVNKETALAIPAFDRAIKIISEQIASIPFSVYRKNADGSITEETTHPIYKLLNFYPSPLYNSFTFRELIIRRLFLYGNVLIDIKKNGSGQVRELQIVEKSFDKFVVDGQMFFKISGDATPRRSDEVIHLYRNPKNDHYGRSDLEVHNDTLGRALSEIYFAATYYGNGAHVSAVLESDKPLKNDQRLEIEEHFQMRYGGNENSNSVLALGAGFKYREMGKKLDTSDIEARKQTSIDISNITGVPAHLLGDQQKTTYSNVEQQNRSFVQYTLRPHCERIESEFNAKLFSSRDIGRLFVQFDLSGLLRGDTEARVKYYRELYNIRAINPNEIRLAENLGSPYEEGDKFGMPLASNSKEILGNETS